EESSKLNAMMASNSAPDIIFSYDTNMIMKYGRDGGLTVLDDLIQEYGPNILANLSASLPYGRYEGKQFAIVALRSQTGRYANYIRKDWLDQMGYNLEVNADGNYHMSVEDFKKLLYDAKEKDLDKTGMEIFPLAVAGAYNATQTKPIIFAFVDRSKLTDEIAACYPHMLWPGFKDGVRFLNQLYNDRIIDPDFMIDTDTSYPSMASLISTGRSLAFGHDDFYKDGIIALYESNPNAEFVVFQLDNIYGEQVGTVYAPTGMYIAVPKTSKNPEAAVKYLDFLADYDTCKILMYGFEGIHYEMVDNVPKAIEYTSEEISKIESYDRTTCGDMELVYNGNPFGYPPYLSKNTPEEIKWYRMHINAKAISQIGGIPEYYFGGIITDAQDKYSGFLPGLESELPSLISAPVAEFDAMYDKVVNEYLEAGGQEVLDAQVELYHKLEASK
ncbi:MAG: extracellular solute-binding protein, partial [Bacillota bacterium]